MYIVTNKISEFVSLTPKPKVDDKDPKEEEETADPAVKDEEADNESPEVAVETPKSGKKNVGRQDNQKGDERDSKGTKNEEDKAKVGNFIRSKVSQFFDNFHFGSFLHFSKISLNPDPLEPRGERGEKEIKSKESPNHGNPTAVSPVET